MKRKEKLLIGEQFNYKKDIDKYYNYFNEFKTLETCYKNCSFAKMQAYNYYKDLLYNNCNKVYHFGVRSYNCNVFTLHAIVKKNGKKYYLLITKYNNYYKEYKGGEK